MDFREIRAKISEYFRSRKVPDIHVQNKWSDEQCRSFLERETRMRSRMPVRSVTRNARLRTNGASIAPAPAPAPSVNDIEQCRARAKAVLDEQEAYERDTNRKRLLLFSL